MARPKEFDEAAVLERALELFRERGYQQTSFADLTQALGVSRQSLYDTYGDKHALFHAALSRYLGKAQDFIRRSFSADTPLPQTLRAFLESMIAGQCSNGQHGCLMVNSMVEMAPHDGDIRALSLEHARVIESIFADRLIRAQREGELGKREDPLALARYLHHVLLGLSVAVRSKSPAAELRQSVELALRVFA